MNYIDLGLPSGTLWTDTNEEGYYTFNEAVEKFGTQLPTRAQFCELVDYTEHYWNTEKKGMTFKGKNGNELFFPALGYRYCSDGSLDNLYNNGLYWSSNAWNNVTAFCLYFYNEGWIYPSGCRSYVYSLSVRLVKDNFTK